MAPEDTPNNPDPRPDDAPEQPEDDKPNGDRRNED